MELESPIEISIAAQATRFSEPWSPPADLLELGDGFVAGLVTMFRIDIAVSLSHMSDLFSNADFDGVRAEAHMIKGVAAQMGVAVMTCLCVEVEEAARDASMSKLEKPLMRLAAAFLRVCDSMEAYSVETRGRQCSLASESGGSLP